MKYQIHQIPVHIFDSLQTNIPTLIETTIDVLSKNVASVPSHALICGVCNVKVDRAHYKSDWHAFNTAQLKLSKPIVTEDIFENTVRDGLSIDGSESDTDSNTDDSDDDLRQNTQDGEINEEVRVKNSPIVLFTLSPLTSIALYKSMLPYSLTLSPLSSFLKYQQPISPTRTIVMVMMSSGHFSAAVFRVSDGTCVANKSFHRYTVRKGQGGAQSALDGRKGNAKSAGASIRRHNEYALQIEVKELLGEWKTYFLNAEVVFWRMPVKGWKDVDGLDESKKRGFPITTRRPTFAELKRCYALLSCVEVVDTPIVEVIVKKDKPVVEKVKVVEEKVKEMKIVDTVHEKSLDLLRKSKSEVFKSHLSKHIIDINAPIDHGTYLHYAAQHSDAVMITFLLELGSNPTTRNVQKKTAYDCCTEKEGRDAFRMFMGMNLEKWDWTESCVPSVLTEEMVLKRKEKNKNKAVAFEASFVYKKREVKEVVVEKKEEVKKVVFRPSNTLLNGMKMDPAVRARLDREKRAVAAEARMRMGLNMCSGCASSLDGMVGFDKYQFRYCSIECVRKHDILDDDL